MLGIALLFAIHACSLGMLALSIACGRSWQHTACYWQAPQHVQQTGAFLWMHAVAHTRALAMLDQRGGWNWPSVASLSMSSWHAAAYSGTCSAWAVHIIQVRLLLLVQWI
jgi:hypothetical protein